MLTNPDFLLQNDLSSKDTDFSVARKMFEEARSNANSGALLRLFGLRRRLSLLSERLAGRNIQRQHSAGLKTVEISRIRGSESRSRDFDGSFAPLSDRLRDRWVAIARARFSRCPLPAVKLIQVGEEYFVRDGHHRVSVAHALGTAYIEADVMVIEL